ncbi:MAG: NAD(P)-dependent alcohol dehydrogenase [Candidatus Andeanibacterium colombiense]|uniref:NAD(P)-dependent alcohol dehydrogenase n=1 Tax=Candidatus Andeanibacterium colombiense TaxID=3121345 RepID=A0AAJ6BP44_9SPHN|nr:MAG: NAD(P)-dependent alcohol dehydrogenase [Sphingomonadaceae bacterium]
MRITAAVSRAGAPVPVLEELELSDSRDDEILVRVVAAGICHTDLNSHVGLGMPVPKPAVLGHEGAGVVEKIGSAVSHLKIGDRVVISGGSCGNCPSCLSAMPSYCREAMPRSFGGRRSDGSTSLANGDEQVASHFFAQSSFATHCVANARGAVPIPEGVPLDVVAPMGCGVITGAGAVIEELRVRPGQSIVVFGVGGVGLSAVMAARVAGAATIVAVDMVPGRNELALELGATHAIDAGAGDFIERFRAILPHGADYSFNTTTAASAFDAAVQVLAMQGVAGFVTRPREPWTPDMMALLAHGRSVKGILGGSASPRLFIPKLVELWRQGRFPVEKMIARYDFADFGQAWHDCETAAVIKPVLMVGEE